MCPHFFLVDEMYTFTVELVCVDMFAAVCECVCGFACILYTSLYVCVGVRGCGFPVLNVFSIVFNLCEALNVTASMKSAI